MDLVRSSSLALLLLALGAVGGRLAPRLADELGVATCAAIGFADECAPLRARWGSETSEGAVFELAAGRVLRLEVGRFGVTLGLGPVHLGVGFGGYHPAPPTLAPAVVLVASA